MSDKDRIRIASRIDSLVGAAGQKIEQFQTAGAGGDDLAAQYDLLNDAAEALREAARLTLALAAGEYAGAVATRGGDDEEMVEYLRTRSIEENAEEGSL